MFLGGPKDDKKTEGHRAGWEGGRLSWHEEAPLPPLPTSTRSSSLVSSLQPATSYEEGAQV